MSDKINFALPIAIIVAALILAGGMVYIAMKPQVDVAKGAENTKVDVPSYLSKGTSVESSGTKVSGAEGVISFAADDSGNKTRLVSVSGTVKKTAEPDKAMIYFSIETLDKSASKSQADNAEIAQKVVDALKADGIAEKDIQTSSYSLNEEFTWDNYLSKSVSTGYKTTNSLQVTLRDLPKVGAVIDSAVQAGANRVNSISFGLSDDVAKQLKTEALKEAAEAARAKAETISSGLGISLGRVYGASESSDYYVPNYVNYSYDAMGGAPAEKAATTPISAGDVEYSVTVNVQFEIAE